MRTYALADTAARLANRGRDVIVTSNLGRPRRRGLHEAPHMVQSARPGGSALIVATACADDGGGGDGGTGAGEVDCATVEFGCVEVGAVSEPNQPERRAGYQRGGCLARSGPGERAQPRDRLPRRVVRPDAGARCSTTRSSSRSRTSLCSAEGGQTAGTALAADTPVVAVVGTSCSSAALGVADTILGDKGITLISGSNTSPALTDPELHNPFYARTAHNDRIQGAIGAEFALGDDLGATTAATIADETPYTQGLVGAFEANFEAGGGTITGSSRSTPRTPTSSRSSGRWPNRIPKSCTSRSSWQRAR